jgi:hypothetical protein
MAWKTAHLVGTLHHGIERIAHRSTMIACGHFSITCSVTEVTILAFVASRSSRLMPGRRASPAVMTTTSLFSVSSYEVVPTISASDPTIGQGLRQVEGLALGHAAGLRHIEQHDISEFHHGAPVGRGGTHITGSDDRNLCARHESHLPSFRVLISVNAAVMSEQ